MHFSVKLTCLALLLSARVFCLTVETAFVGDSGNAADALTGYGAVDYPYYIGCYEVTNTEYAAFLNAIAVNSDTYGLYDVSMGSNARGGIDRVGEQPPYSYTVKTGYENRPVTFVSFWDACRFANWLTNGQPTGEQVNSTTEDGMYPLNGSSNPVPSSTLRNPFAFQAGGVAVASEDEWYKAAYYDPTLNSGAGAYWLYPTRSDSFPSAEVPPGGVNSANLSGQVEFSGSSNTSAVGAYTQSFSYYGTYDQAGNVAEFTDSFGTGTSNRALRDASYLSFANPLEELTASTHRSAVAVTAVNAAYGFRLSSLEPIVLAAPGEESTMNALEKYAYAANAGWIDLVANKANGIVVSDYFLSGYAYAANFGWIHFGDGSPDNGYAYSNQSATDYGVNFDQNGALQGYAYAPNVGWINFEKDWGDVTIDRATGEFSGYAYSANLGWIDFGSGVTTDFVNVPDSDRDTLSDAWEYQNFGDLQTASAETDVDGDGARDGLEAQFLTGGDDPDSKPYLHYIERMTADTGSTLELLRPAHRRITLFESADLLHWNRSRIFEGVQADEILIADHFHPASPKRFFRMSAAGSLDPDDPLQNYQRGTLAWSEVTAVDSVDLLGGNSLAFSPEGNPYIAYYDATNSDLRLAYRSEGVWYDSLIDAEGFVGEYVSLAFSPLSGQPAMAYYDRTNAALKYATYENGVLEVSTLDGADWIVDKGRHASLAFGPDGYPAIAHLNQTEDDLELLRFDGTQWTSELVDGGSSNEDGEYASLAFGPDGNPAIAYMGSSGGRTILKYARFDGVNWQIETADADDKTGWYSSLAFDRLGNPAIAHSDQTNGERHLLYTTQVNGIWERVTVDDSEGISGARNPSLIFMPDNTPAIGYYAVGDQDLHFARFDGTGWNIETVASANSRGRYISIALAPEGLPAIVDGPGNGRQIFYSTLSEND